MGYQVKTLGYADRSMRRDMRRALKGVGLGKSWLRLAVVVGRALAAVLCAVCLVFAVILTVIMAMDPAELGGDGVWVTVLFWAGFLLFLLLSLVVRPLPDPIRENLWPPEADVITVTFLDQAIQVEDGRSVIQLEYQSLRSLKETQECFYLFPMKEHLLMLRKRDFVEGDPAQFKVFLAGKLGNRLLV